MSDTFLFANNASSALAGPISNAATQLNLASGPGALFPNPSAGQQFAMAAMVQTSALYPSRIITASGVFVMTNADANGGIGLNRLIAPAVSSTTLPGTALAGQLYAIEDLAKNFNAYPVTVNAPVGMSIAGAASVVLNVNGQCGYFRFYGSNIWSFKP